MPQSPASAMGVGQAFSVQGLIRIEARFSISSIFKGYFSGSESVPNLLQRLHKDDLVSYLLESKLVFVSFKILESIYLSSTSPKLAWDRWGSITFMKSTPQITL